jgi:hypothetical protein
MSQPWIVLAGFAVLVTLGGPQAIAIDLDLPARVAEKLYFTGAHSENVQQWSHALKLSTSRQHDIKVFLASHPSAEHIPVLHWESASPVLNVGWKSTGQTLNLSKIAQRQLVVNNVSVTIPATSNLTDAIAILKRALKSASPTAFLDRPLHWLLQEAQAAEDDPKSGPELIDIIAYYSGIEEQGVCENGGEGISGKGCSSRSNAEMIKADMYDDTLTAFQCDGDKFKYFSFVGSALRTAGLAMDYDRQGHLQGITTYLDKKIDCKYVLDDGRFVTSTPSSQRCFGRGVDEYLSLPHPLVQGTVLKVVDLDDVPLQRLQDCCKDSCKMTLAALAKQNSAADDEFTSGARPGSPAHR